MRDKTRGTERRGRGRVWPGGRREEDRGGVLSAEDPSLRAKKTARPEDTGRTLDHVLAVNVRQITSEARY